MSESSDNRQRWLGIITLISCSGILWGLLMPAVGSRPASRRTQCINNLKNFALATINFETTKKKYPGYQSTFGIRGDGAAKIGSWAVSLFPYLEQQALRDEWDDPAQHDSWLAAVRDRDEKMLQAFYPTISIFNCPSDTLKKAKYAGSSYAANAGFYLMSDDPALGMDVYTNAIDASERSTISQRAANGIFANRLGQDVIDPQTGNRIKVFGNCKQPIRSDDIREDGLTHAILFTENCNSLSWKDFSITNDSSRCKLGIVWLYAGKSSSEGRPKPMPMSDAMRINHNKNRSGNGPLRARPSGMHPGVINAAFADGSTKGISEEIDYRVYQSLMAPHDAQSDIPDLDYVLKEEDYIL